MHTAATIKKTGILSQISEAYGEVKEVAFFKPHWIALDFLIIAACLFK